MKPIALVTGANRGIGLAIAKGMASKGYTVLMGCRNIHTAKAEAATINAIPVKLDLSDRAILNSDINNILSRFPTIDVLVNNAGILEQGTMTDVGMDAFFASMRVNFEAPCELIHAVVPHMMQRGYGRIVNVSSGWGAFSDGLNGPAAYSVSKAALNALTLSYSNSMTNNVKVNAMCPGWVRTKMGGPAATRSPGKGAETALWLATLDENGPNGGFFRDKQPISW